MNSTVKTILKLLLASFLVGVLLHTLGITPADFWGAVVDFFVWLFSFVTGFFGDNLIYVVTGAAIVVPIFLYSRFKAHRRNRRSGGTPSDG